MPFISLLLESSGPSAPLELQGTVSTTPTSALFLQGTVSTENPAFPPLVLLGTVTTWLEPVIGLSLTGFVNTLNLGLVAQGGNSSARAYRISHGGLEAWDVLSWQYSYAPGADGTGKPSASMTVKGKVEASGTINIVTSATSEAGDAYTAHYGPLNLVASKQRLGPTGWISDLSAVDTTLEDINTPTPAAPAGSPPNLDNLMPILDEWVPWEAERDLTPLQHAQKARTDALKEQAIRILKLKCAQRRKLTYDGRSILVDALATRAVGILQGILPTVISSSSNPNGDSRFYAETRLTGGVRAVYPILIGTSYRTKGKTPRGIVQDLWGVLGYEIQLKDGKLWIGYPSDIATMQKSLEQGSALATVPTESQAVSSGVITSFEVERISASTSTSTTSTHAEPQLGTAAFDLPRSITLEGAEYEYALDPIPDDPGTPGTPAPTPPPPANGPYNLGDAVVQRGNGVIESITRTMQTYEGSLLILETQTTDGLRPLSGWSEALIAPAVGSQVTPGERWQSPLKTSITARFYGVPLYSKAERGSSKTVQAYHDEMGYAILEEQTDESKVWHAEGWLQKRISHTQKFAEILKITQAVGGGSVTYTYPLYTFENEIEEWTPQAGERWHHRITHSSQRHIPIREDGEIIGSSLTAMGTTVTDEITSNKPDTATADSSETRGTIDDPCPDDSDPAVFPYTVKSSFTRFTAGRGLPQTISVPWLRSPAAVAGSIPDAISATTGQIAQQKTIEKLLEKQLARTRTTINFRVPVTVRAGRTVSVQANGTASSSTVSMTIEEAIPGV